MTNVHPRATADQFQSGSWCIFSEWAIKYRGIFQIKLNKQGLISGEYYNATTDQTSPISGSVDKKSQRAAWTIADKKTPVYEAGIANLTKAETTIVLYGTGPVDFKYVNPADDPPNHK